MSDEPVVRSESGSERDWPVITAADALAQLQTKGTLARVTVSGLRLRGEFTLPISFNHVRLIRPTFEGAIFKDTVEFIGCTLQRAVFNRRTTFEKSVRFSGACTLRRADFGNVVFTGNARFDGSVCEGSLKFWDCEFTSGCRFWDARIGGWTEFTRCQFKDEADFRSMHVDQGLQFTQCVFTGDALLRGTYVAKKLDFTTSRFEKLLDFSKAKLHDFVYLETIDQGPAQTFAFSNMIGERLLISSRQLAGRVVSESKQDYSVAMLEFGLLKRNFESLHRYDDEDWAFYRFKVNQRRSRATSWLRPWTKLLRLADKVLLDWGCGYGTNPFRAVTTALIIVLLFGALYGAESHHFDAVSPPLGFLPKDGLVNRAVFGLMTSVSVFTAGFSGDHLRSAHGWVLLPLASEALLGTLLWGLFIVAFSRKVIR